MVLRRNGKSPRKSRQPTDSVPCREMQRRSHAARITIRAMKRSPAHRSARRAVVSTLTGALASASGGACASFLSGEALDTAADIMSWVVLFLSLIHI